MARKTRRASVVWLPLDTTNRIQEVAAATSGAAQAGFQTAINVTGGPSQNVTLLPLVKDEPQSIAGTTETLSDLEGSAYRLRRVVGKIIIQPQQIATLGTVNDHTLFMVTAGLIVLRVDNQGAILSGSTVAYDVQSLDSTRDPWIWRRSWFLSDKAQILAQNAASPDSRTLEFPISTALYGSVADAGHIDAKTARIVSDEERLFLVLSAITLDGSAQGADTVIFVFGEVRVLASMRKQSGNRRNASR